MTINISGAETGAMSSANPYTRRMWSAGVVQKLRNCGVEHALLNYGRADICWRWLDNHFEESRGQPVLLHDAEWYFSVGSGLHAYRSNLLHERLAVWPSIYRAGSDSASLVVSLLANMLNNSRVIHVGYSIDLRNVMVTMEQSVSFVYALQDATMAALKEARLPGYNGAQEPELSTVQHIELVSVGLPAFVRVLNDQPHCAERVKRL